MSVTAAVERLRRGDTGAAAQRPPVPVGARQPTDRGAGQVYAATGYGDGGRVEAGITAGHASREEAAGLAADCRVAQLPWAGALLVGATQILALLPGISRSGSTSSPVCCAACRTRTPPGSRSCSPPR
jgi:hypothetical protein